MQGGEEDSWHQHSSNINCLQDAFHSHGVTICTAKGSCGLVVNAVA
jgi:hypothetical protein